MAQISGRCLCGAVSYTTSDLPTFVAVCHCGACKRYTGSAFAFFLIYPSAEFSAVGPLKSYTTQGDSRKDITRYFCADCGSGIYEEAESRPDNVLINGGSLDYPEFVKPTVEAFCKSKLEWATLESGMRKFPGMPS